MKSVYLDARDNVERKETSIEVQQLATSCGRHIYKHMLLDFGCSFSSHGADCTTRRGLSTTPRERGGHGGMLVSCWCSVGSAWIRVVAHVFETLVYDLNGVSRGRGGSRRVRGVCTTHSDSCRSDAGREASGFSNHSYFQLVFEIRAVCKRGIAQHSRSEATQHGTLCVCCAAVSHTR